ncbi:MAG: type IV pili methyl-accepting chemotaxis transducer N-terminal domain-containing protein [Nitrosomonadales bacterium]|nr:type IV pili methyl-accepting chemotaxis transducer N-terminal domain-containing protein [Nitrosomonadales bacterium]
MAFKFALNLFGKQSARDATRNAGSAAAKMKILGIAAASFFVLTAVSAYIGNREDVYSVRYVGQSSQLMMLSQRLANAAQQALYGNSAAFDALAESRARMLEIMTRLDEGDTSLPATSGGARTALDEYMQSARKTLQDAQTVEAGRSGLVTLGVTLASIDTVGVELRAVTQKMMGAFDGAQKEQSTRFALTVERIGKDAGRLLAEDVTIEQVAGLGADTLAATESLSVLPETDANVARARNLFGSYRNSVEILVSQVRSLVAAKAASKAIVSDSELLLAKSQQLVDAYQATLTGRTANVATLLFGLLLLGSLALLVKTYLDDTRQRGEEAARINSQNQNAILRLMNELGDLADGDLTVRATVTEDITGAIADSLNYTTEEFRKLVARITAAVEQMGNATKDAEDISKGLLEAAQKQAKEIHGAGEAVQLMTRSIKEVDSSAAQSADVARRTLAATEQGAQAVRNTISGMDVLREQIQDTAKRIKRLGESSQEIGEIVDLISDITEQTNVLALNAAIQAASAGEAGRGFSVVAEEVQRLAERSAEATKQIGALVKTIQGDTHDAVAAMEKSTLGVVEGAKLSDMAGQSLREIEQVSNELAALINSISTSTQVQSDMASEVASVMQDILQITVQTTEGTRLTANSIAQLTGLTADLRGSVAGFKL